MTETTETRDSRDISDEQAKIVEKAAKILRLSARNDSPEEAARAAEKVQEMLLAYNLSMATIEKKAAGEGSSERGKREDAATAGGQYQYQRDLWDAIARLNFCIYFSTEERAVRSKRRRLEDGTMIDAPRYYMRRQHRIVGRVVNTTITRNTADYIERTIERICRERYPQQSQFFSHSAVMYREGMADEVRVKLNNRRKQRVREDREREEERLKRAGVASDTAVSLAHYIDAETDANNDVIHGEGWSARQAQRRADFAAREAERERQQAEYDAAHPEEAAARRKEEERELKKYRSRLGRGGGPGSRGGKGRIRDEQAYWAGRDRGAEIGIDPQTESARASQGRLT